MGMGAVMGSKNLKAIVLQEKDLPPVYDADSCEKITVYYREKMRENPLTLWQLEPPGFSCWVHTHGIDTALCTRNYSQSVFEHAGNYAPDKFMQQYLGESPCPGCPNNCIKRFLPEGEPQMDTRAAGMHQEICGTLGPNCGIADVETVFRANELCSQFGLDPTSLGFTLSMAMELSLIHI